MSKHSHISAIFDNAFQSRAGSPDVCMSMLGALNFLSSRNGVRLSTNINTKCKFLFRFLRIIIFTLERMYVHINNFYLFIV